MKKQVFRWLTLLCMAAMLTGCGKQADGGTELGTEIDSQVGTEQDSEISSETEKDPVVTTVTVTATGDCALGALQYHEYAGSFHKYYDSYGEGYFFQNFKEIFQSDDLTLVNLECVFTTAENRVEKKFNIKGPMEYTGILTFSSVEAVSMGNNHSEDYGPESTVDTKNALDAAGVLYAINDTISYFTTEEGMVVAMVSANITGEGNERDQYLLDGVVAARNQGAEVYNGKIILYSLGNFSFGANRNPADKDTAVYQQTFTFVDGVLQSDITAKIIPTRLSGHDKYNDYQPAIANEAQASVIIQRMNEYSEPYSGVFFDEQGNLLVEENN